MAVTFKALGNHGRLANTMFQCAVTIALAYRNNDTYLFPNGKYEDYFHIPKNNFLNIEKIRHDSTYEEPHFHYTPIKYKKRLNLFGYFQSEKYFDDCKKIIRTLLTPKQQFKELDGICSLHVRRGDYTQPHLYGCFNILPIDYYESAIKQIKTRKFMIFSDDIDWCKKHFKGNKFIFSEKKSPIIDLSLMISCEHHICANSSFSWWGAWLNKNKNKKIIVPSKWFGPKLQPTHNTKDLIPDGWIVI